MARAIPANHPDELFDVVPAHLKLGHAVITESWGAVLIELVSDVKQFMLNERTRDRLKAEGIMGTMYSHPIGKHGHGAGPIIGLWDYQEGVPGRGDAKVNANMGFSSELQTTSPVPEWGGQPVRMAQEEDMIIDAAGKVRWAFKRQDKLFLIK